MKRFLVFLVLFSVYSLTVYAEEAESDHKVSVTISPFHLLNPELHLTGELQLTTKTSAAIMFGAGKITDEGKTCKIWEAGGQFRYYLIGSFRHGMMLGTDIGYIETSSAIENPIAYLVGTHAGFFMGYKITMKVGFTGEFQIGPIYLWGETKKTSELQTLLALKIGWSF